ncbi:hypothetical protein DFJ77DRAFT_458113 [Powellomyces hirtus]|nr:hypothetical protein DFJ77DRAFT_458113 [Powellomyces hirtus]
MSRSISRASSAYGGDEPHPKHRPGSPTSTPLSTPYSPADDDELSAERHEQPDNVGPPAAQDAEDFGADLVEKVAAIATIEECDGDRCDAGEVLEKDGEVAARLGGGRSEQKARSDVGSAKSMTHLPTTRSSLPARTTQTSRSTASVQSTRVSPSRSAVSTKQQPPQRLYPTSSSHISKPHPSRPQSQSQSRRTSPTRAGNAESKAPLAARDTAARTKLAAHASSAQSIGELDDSHSSGRADMDQDVHMFSESVDKWTGLMRRAILADFMSAKSDMTRRQNQTILDAKQAVADELQLLRERLELAQADHAAAAAQAVKSERLMGRMLVYLSKKRTTSTLGLLFARWRLKYADERRVRVALRMATQHASRILTRKVLQAWKEVAGRTWRRTVERRVQMEAEQKMEGMAQEYDKRIEHLDKKLEEVHARLHISESARGVQEEEMKKAFMRGVCALNMEAMSMFRPPLLGSGSGPDHPHPNPPPNHNNTASSPAPPPPSSSGPPKSDAGAYHPTHYMGSAAAPPPTSTTCRAPSTTTSRTRDPPTSSAATYAGLVGSNPALCIPPPHAARPTHPAAYPPPSRGSAFVTRHVPEPTVRGPFTAIQPKVVPAFPR